MAMAPEVDLAQLLPLPTAFICPITQELMVDPVAAADGTVYERAAIVAWFSNPKCGNRSPITNEPLPTTKVSEIVALRRAIEEYMAHRPELIRRELNRAAVEAVVRLLAEDLENKGRSHRASEEGGAALQRGLVAHLLRLQGEVAEMDETMGTVWNTVELLLEEVELLQLREEALSKQLEAYREQAATVAPAVEIPNAASSESSHMHVVEGGQVGVEEEGPQKEEAADSPTIRARLEMLGEESLWEEAPSISATASLASTTASVESETGPMAEAEDLFDVEEGLADGSSESPRGAEDFLKRTLRTIQAASQSQALSAFKAKCGHLLEELAAESPAIRSQLDSLGWSVSSSRSSKAPRAPAPAAPKSAPEPPWVCLRIWPLVRSIRASTDPHEIQEQLNDLAHYLLTSEEGVDAAAQALQHLVHKAPHCHQHLLETDAFRILLICLEHSQTGAQEAVASCLTHMFPGLAVEPGRGATCATTCCLLQSGPPLAKLAATRALRCFTRLSYDARAVAAQGGAVSALLELMDEGSAASTLEAAATLRQIAQHEDGRRAILATHYVPVLCKVIETASYEAREHAAYIFHYLGAAGHRLECRELAETADLLVRLARLESEGCRQAAGKALGSLVEACKPSPLPLQAAPLHTRGCTVQ